MKVEKRSASRTGSALLAFVVTCLSGLPLLGDTSLYVAPNGNDTENDGLSVERPFKTPQKAMDAIATLPSNKKPFIVVLAAGRYALESPMMPQHGYDIAPLYNNMTIRGATGSAADVVLDGQGKTDIIRFGQHATDASGNTANYGVKIFDLTVTNGWKGVTGTSSVDLDYSGAGIAMSYGNTVSNCVVADCRICTTNGTARGAGIYLGSGGANVCNTIVERCAISNVWTTGTGAQTTVGAGIFFNGGTIASCIVRDCSIWNNDSGNTGFFDRIGGGGIYNRGGNYTICDTEVCRCMLSNAFVKVSDSAKYNVSGNGAGLSVVTGSGYTGTIRNCHIHHNVAPCAGAGVYMSGSGKATISGCTITSNDIVMVQTTNYGFGGGLCISGAVTADGCRLVGNRLDKRGYNGGGAGFALVTDDLCLVKNCLIEGNSAPAGGGGMVGSDGRGLAAVVSNCIFRANAATKNNGGGAFGSYQAKGTLVTDCLIVSNTAPRGAVFAEMCDNKTADIGGVTFRNCLMAGNAATGTGHGSVYTVAKDTSSGLIPLRLEQCTIVGNDAERDNTMAVNAVDVRHVTVKGCVIANNGLNGDRNMAAAFAASEKVSCSCAPKNWDSMPHDAALHNVDCDDPLFLDASNGDWRLSAKSPLIDKGGPAEPWMGSGARKDGPRDLGQPSWTVAQAGNWGVAISREKTSPRLYNALPDIGCYEYYVAPGLLLMFH